MEVIFIVFSCLIVGLCFQIIEYILEHEWNFVLYREFRLRVVMTLGSM